MTVTRAPDLISERTRRVCDLCGVYSGAERGSSCSTCALGTMRYLSELDLIRDQRRKASRAALLSAADRP
jgi:hypothetical protein